MAAIDLEAVAEEMGVTTAGQYEKLQLGWKKENYLKRFDPNDIEASTLHLTQLIKRKASASVSAHGEFNT